jgi:hypothetical protein
MQNSKYPWEKMKPRESFFVAGFPAERVKKEVLKDAGDKGLIVRARAGIYDGKYGVLFTLIE